MELFLNLISQAQNLIDPYLRQYRLYIYIIFTLFYRTEQFLFKWPKNCLANVTQLDEVLAALFPVQLLQHVMVRMANSHMVKPYVDHRYFQPSPSKCKASNARGTNLSMYWDKQGPYTLKLTSPRLPIQVWTVLLLHLLANTYKAYIHTSLQLSNIDSRATANDMEVGC